MATLWRLGMLALAPGAALGLACVLLPFPDGDLMGLSLVTCAIAGLLTGLRTKRVELAGAVGGTTGLLGSTLLFLDVALAHWRSAAPPALPMLAGIAATLVLLTIAGFLCGAIAGAIASPLQAARVTLAAASEGPASRGLRFLWRAAGQTG
ncbi:MAG: hypothetical protein M3072_07125 [Candidatus Dormibacteraeota bacterium]|nr:hypothetical protein [Candidatus Dormibacteraeota bacterium]